LTTSARTELVSLLKELRGLPGAASLARSLGVSRRQAALAKAEELRAQERARQAACGRVRLLAPGVMRGFDAMYVKTSNGPRFPLVAGDGAVPFRTSISVAERYGSTEVEKALAQDLDEHGAPLVLRLDRASCQRHPRILSMLTARGVLSLHGPARHPLYYGQLERQNREHRAWLDRAPVTDTEALARECEAMRRALNGRWRRRTLGWRTAEELWVARPEIRIDRDVLRDEVLERAARLTRGGTDADTAMRLAIEAALVQRGLIEICMPRRGAM
jgi:hypothetical protein